MSSFGGGGGSANPTPQQQQLMTEQALTTAQLNLEENAQRKAILNAMMGTRVFRGSALSRSLRGNTEGVEEPPPASASQINKYNQIVGPATRSLLDEQAAGSGATPAGGAGGSGAGGVAPGGRAGGSIGGGGRGR